jgi:hypothetical protein
MPAKQQSKRSKSRSRSDDIKHYLAQQHLRMAGQRIDDEQECSASEKSGSAVMKIVIAAVLIVWIITMIILAKTAFKKKNADETTRSAIEDFQGFRKASTPGY